MKIKSNAFALGGYAVPALLWATLFVQVVLFQWACYHNLLITSLWKSPDHFLVFWLSKIGIALFLASFALLSKRKWWTNTTPSPTTSSPGATSAWKPTNGWC